MRGYGNAILAVLGPVDALKVNQHESVSSSSTTFLITLHPTVAVIDVGTSKFYHPTQDVLNRLSVANCVIYQTEKGNGGSLATVSSDYVANGSNKITTDGEKQFNVYHGDENPNVHSIK